MPDFCLKKHRVANASFMENFDVGKKKGTEIGVKGNIVVPKVPETGANIIVTLQFHMGSANERLFLTLETISAFEVKGGFEEQLTEKTVQEKCLPIALAELRKTVKKVTEAYGLPPLDLSPFEEENIIEE